MLFLRLPRIGRFCVQCGRSARVAAVTEDARDRGVAGSLGHKWAFVRWKRTRLVKLPELPQGLVVAPRTAGQSVEAGETAERREETAPSYPTVVLQARRNMARFDNCVLLTRVGGFYELYFEHADEYGPRLNLKVAQKKTSAGLVPMAGFPFFQLDRFLKMLVQDLKRCVAIAEEFPNNASEKTKSGGLMHDRRVARIITPGTLIDESFLDPCADNFIMAIHAPPSGADNGAEPAAPVPLGLAWLDLSTGSFFTQTTSLAQLGSVLSRVSPREVVLDRSLAANQNHGIHAVLTECRPVLVSHAPPGWRLQTLADWTFMLEADVPPETVSSLTHDEMGAGSLLLDYVRDRLRGTSTKLQPPQRHDSMQVMAIDKHSMRSLEIRQTMRDGAFHGSLLHAIRRTVTRSGARLLNEWLGAPSTCLDVINSRLDLVERFLGDEPLRDGTVLLLRNSHDSQRLVQKFALNRGGPDELLRLATTIQATEDIVRLLQRAVVPKHARGAEKDCLVTMIGRIQLDQPSVLARTIRDAIDEEGLVQQHRLEDEAAGVMLALARDIVKAEAVPEDGLLLPKGASSKLSAMTKKPTASPASSIREHYGEDNQAWVMKPGASPTLARLHADLAALLDEKLVLAENLRSRLRASSLTLRWTPGLGHICHLKGKDTSIQLSDAASPLLMGRTLSSSRTTRAFDQPQWTYLGERIDKTCHLIRGEESRIIGHLRSQVINNLVRLRRHARVLDELDIAAGLATLAKEQNLVRPKVVDPQPPPPPASSSGKDGSVSRLQHPSSHTILLSARHPTVEPALHTLGRTFTPNDLILGPSPSSHPAVWLVTGPNMAGKSTFLRQSAQHHILAQTGSFVAASYAELSVCDAVFSRVGSADNLAADQSTFMVEMLETAHILRTATPRSFVIMDEVGRGTTPRDGEAVAFAVLKYLAERIGCRALFATHFHGVVDLVGQDGDLTGHGFGGASKVEFYCTDVEEDGKGGFVYVHRLRKGVSRESHALKVAGLAGLPSEATRVAREVLEGKRAKEAGVG